MKKILLVLTLSLSFIFVMAQNVEREMVLMEIGTGTWCVWCPGAATGADELVEGGHDVAVVENHNGDPYANTYSNARNTYNGVGGGGTGFPTATFDGVETDVGGAQCPNPTGKIDDYLPIVNQRLNVASNFTMSMQGNHSGLNYNVTIQIDKVGSPSTDNCVVHLFLTESHIPEVWFGCMLECNFVNRLMVPDQNGTTLSIASGSQTVNLSFAVDAGWDTDHCELVACVQNNSSHEALQTIKMDLADLTPPPVVADFEADETMLCEGSLANYTDLSAGIISQWNWTFEGGTPATSTDENPVVTYNTAGEYDVTLYVSDGYTNDEITKTAYVNVAAGTPGTPDSPIGESFLCKNPENQQYTTNEVAGAAVYDWVLDPPNIGFIMNDGAQTVTINFVNAWVGEATLAVKAVNGCGESDLSDALTIVIDERPDVFEVTGGGLYCEDGTGVGIGLSGSQLDVDYELYLNDEPTGNIISGTGDPLNFDDIAVAGMYTIMASNTMNICDNLMDNFAEVSMVPKPIAYNITGGGDYCVNSSGSEVGLDGSEMDCNYELYLDGVATGNILVGTGGPVSFGDVTGIGEYTAVATEQSNFCSNYMEGTTAVDVILLPEIPVTIDGPDYVDVFLLPTTEYTTEGSNYSASYEWSLEPVEAGEVEIISVYTSEVNWSNTFEGTATIKVKGINECGESDWSEGFDVVVYNSVGFNNPDAGLGINISPNPTSGQFTLNLTTTNEKILSIRITNSLNSVVYKSTDIHVNGKYTEKINLGNVSNGIYLLLIETKESIISRKLLIQR